MVDEFLNQDEIDALLSGEPSFGGSLTPEDLSVLGEVANIVANAASNVVGMLAGRGVTAEVSGQAEIPQASLKDRMGEIAKVFSYSLVLSGLNSAPAVLATSEKGALALADLMMGGDAKELPEEANDLYLSAAQEGLSQLVGSALTNLSGLLGGTRLSADSAASSLEDIVAWTPFPAEAGDVSIWVVKIIMDVEEVEPFFLNLVLPSQNAHELAEKVREAMNPSDSAPQRAAVPAPAPARQPQGRAPQPAADVPLPAAPPRAQAPPVDAKPAEFAQLGAADYAGAPGNIDLIVDIPVRVTVELGRTRKTIGEVLALGPGSVVELNKMAGEPVDVLVNGKLIARGEVVVIDESFGIRVTEVVSKAERIRSMGV